MNYTRFRSLNLISDWLSNKSQIENKVSRYIFQFFGMMRSCQCRIHQKCLSVFPLSVGTYVSTIFLLAVNVLKLHQARSCQLFVYLFTHSYISCMSVLLFIAFPCVCRPLAILFRKRLYHKTWCHKSIQNQNNIYFLILSSKYLNTYQREVLQTGLFFNRDLYSESFRK